jgi:hypothetical protein
MVGSLITGFPSPVFGLLFSILSVVALNRDKVNAYGAGTSRRFFSGGEWRGVRSKGDVVRNGLGWTADVGAASAPLGVGIPKESSRPTPCRYPERRWSRTGDGFDAEMSCLELQIQPPGRGDRE